MQTQSQQPNSEVLSYQQMPAKLEPGPTLFSERRETNKTIAPKSKLYKILLIFVICAGATIVIESILNPQIYESDRNLNLKQMETEWPNERNIELAHIPTVTDDDQSSIFDLIVFINLDSRTDRLDFMKRKLSFIPQRVYRWRARNTSDPMVINTLNISKKGSDTDCIDDSKSVGVPRESFKNSLGVVALYHTWLDLFDFVTAHNISSIFVIEDDIYFISDAWQRIKYLSQNDTFITDDVVYFGTSQDGFTQSQLKTIRDAPQSRENTYSYHILPDAKLRPWGTYGFVLNRNGIEAVQNTLRHNCPAPVDVLLIETVRRMGGAKVIIPNLAIPDVRDSDLREAKNLGKHSKKRHWNLVDYQYSYLNNYTQFIAA